MKAKIKKEEDYIIETENGKQFDYEAMERDVRTGNHCPFTFMCPDETLDRYDVEDLEGCVFCVKMFKERTESNESKTV
mgnify:CR=1 FL=1